MTSAGFAEWSKTSEASVARFDAAMESVRVSMGQNLVGPMDVARDTMTGLAQAFVELPAPMQAVVSWGAAVAGVGLTLAGGFLLAAPRISATKAAFADLALAMPKTIGAMRGLGSLLAGPFGIALGAATGLVLAYANAKADRNRRADNFLMILGQEIDLVNLTADAYDNLSAATRKGFAENLIAEHDQLLGLLERTGVALDDVVRVLLGDTGPAYDRVSAAIDEHTSKTFLQKDGYERLAGPGQELARIIGWNGDAMEEAARKQEHLNSISDETEEGFEGIAGAAAETSPALEALAGAFNLVADDAAAAAQEMLDSWAEGASQFGDIMDAYNNVLDSKQEKERESAEAAAEAAGETSASWEAFSKDVKVSIDEYIAELERMVADQAAGADNMVQLAGRVPPGMFDELARLGPEGAPLVAELVRAGDSELKRVGELWPHTTAEGMRSVTDAIADTDIILRAVADQLGQGVANSLRDGMRKNSTNVFQEAERQGILIDDGVGVNRPRTVKASVKVEGLQSAEWAINNVARTRTAMINIGTSTRPVMQPAGGGQKSFSHGGLITGPGGPTDDRIPIMASNREFMIRNRAVEHFGVPFFDALNDLRLPGMAAGGLIGAQSSIPMPRQAGQAVHVNVTLSPGMDEHGVMGAIVKGLRHEVHHRGGSVQATLGGR
jgi:hypothetical protein